MQANIRQQDVEGVKQTILDSVEGTFQVDSSRIERSVHADLTKIGFIRVGGSFTGYRMTLAGLPETASTYNQDGQIGKDAPKTITVFEMLDQTASAIFEAWWGIDYLHLAKQGGKWMIMNVLWRTNSPEAG